VFREPGGEFLEWIPPPSAPIEPCLEVSESPILVFTMSSRTAAAHIFRARASDSYQAAPPIARHGPSAPLFRPSVRVLRSFRVLGPLSPRP